MSEGKVDFFIVGAMKSGTSSLRDMLRQHPQIDLYRGEIHYFDRPEHYARGPDWYHGHFGPARPGLLRGDKSPSYSLDPHIADRIARYNPEARIVWILRHPLRRLISNYHHSRTRKPEEALSIEASIAAGDRLVRENVPFTYLYRSQYDRHLAGFFERIDRSRHRILIFEDFLDDPAGQARGLCGWLGIDPDVALEFPHSNPKKPQVARRFPAHPEDLAWVQDLLKPTIDYVETLLGREIVQWHRP